MRRLCRTLDLTGSHDDGAGSRAFSARSAKARFSSSTKPSRPSADCGSRPARSWSSNSSGIRGALRRAMRGLLPSRCHGPHTEFLTVPQLAGPGEHGLAAIAVAAVGSPFGCLAAQMVVHLGVQRPFSQGPFQLVEQASTSAAYT